MLSSLNVQEHHVTGTSALDIECKNSENCCTYLPIQNIAHVVETRMCSSKSMNIITLPIPFSIIYDLGYIK